MTDPHIAELQAELDRLRAREAQLSGALDDAAVPIQWVDDQGVVVWANRAQFDLLGYAAEEYVGRRVADFDADRGVAEDICRHVAAGGVVRDRVARLRHRDGSLRHVVISAGPTGWFTRDISALRESHALLESLLHHSPLPVVVLTADGLVTLWNAAAERAFGWKAAEVLGKPLPFIPTEKLAEHRAMRASDLSGQGFAEREIRRVRKDGRPIDLLVSTDQLRDPGDAVKAIISVYLDITDRKSAHEEVRQAGERLLFALDAAAMMAWDWGPDDDRVTRAGDLADQLGLAPESSVRHYFDLIHPDDRARVIDAFDETLHDGVELDVEFRVVLPDGAIRWMSDRGRLTSAVPPRRVSGVMLDITARKTAQEELHESEQRLQEILDNAPAVVYLKDTQGRYLLVNRRFVKVFNFDAVELLGKTDADIFSPEDGAVYRANDLEVIEQGVPKEFEESAQQEDGVHTYLSVKFPLRNARGDVYAVCGISTDITERQRLEAKLRESAKLESLGVLAGGVAHDFNNLLVGIVGNASLLQHESPAGSLQRQVLDSIVQAGERAAQLTRQMLAFAGRAQFALAPLDLAGQVRQIVRLLEAALPKHVTLSLRLAPALPPIEADPGQLQQVVMNLILNAAEAIDPPAGTVEVSASMEDWAEADLRRDFGGDLPAGRYVALRVADTGCGMDAATRSRIFDPFFTTKFTGRGLGLAATLGILRAHRAGIHVESAPGAGSTFTVLFPPSRRELPPDGPAAAAETFAGARVLIVDDEHSVRQVARLALERRGCVVTAVADGLSAMEWMDAHPGVIDVLLLDLAMPVCGGEVVLAYVRDRRPDIRVVCSSGYAEGEASARFGPGADAFLQKPYTIAQLMDAIRRALRAARA